MVSLEVQFPDVRRIPQGARVLGESGSHWGVIKASTVALPSMGLKIRDCSRHGRIGRSPLQGGMPAMSVEVGPEIEQLVFEIRARPEQRAIQILASNGAD